MKCGGYQCRKKPIWIWKEAAGDQTPYCADHFEMELLKFIEDRDIGELSFERPDGKGRMGTIEVS